MPTAADVPNKFDCVINGQGYLCADMQDVKGEFVLSPIFIPRQNTQGDYGDDQQDFWLTYTQRDWALGEQQRYQGRDDDGKRRYWQGTGVDVRTPGQVSMRAGISTNSIATAVSGGSPGWLDSNGVLSIPYASSTNLYSITAALVVNDRGAHGLGAAPSLWGITTDSTNIFLGTTAAGTVGIRKMNGAGTFSTFSASSADSLAFLNNALYGLRNTNGDLVRWDTAGVLTSLFTWKDASGTAIALGSSKVIPFGGKLAILRFPAVAGLGGPSELWIYDGTAPAIIEQFPPGFIAYDISQAFGTLFISGTMPLASGSGTTTTPVVFYWSQGTIGRLWKANTSSTVPPALVAWNDGLLFTDASRFALMFYDPSVGGVQTISTSWSSTGNNALGASDKLVFGINGTTTGYIFQDSGTRLTSSTVTSSLVDFDSSLTKLFRGIKVEFDSATDGNGGTVDISYRVGDVDGSYTSLQTGATSGIEYTLSGVTGRSLSIKVTLNKGTSTNGPVLKRIAVRAAPQLPTGPSGAGFRKFTLVLDLHGVKAPLEGQMMRLRDDTVHNKSGAEMATNLFTAAASTSPISVTTELHGTISTMLVDQENFKVQRIRKNEYLAYVPLREV